MIMLSFRSDVRVRRARLSDAADLAEVHRRSWLSAYRGMIPHTQLMSMLDRRSSGWWRDAVRSRETLLVLEVADTIAGYATCGPSRTNRRFEGEIYELYLDPGYQGLGFGEYLFEACRATLDERCLRGLIVWVLADNDAAARFYFARGGRAIAETVERLGSVNVAKRAYTWD